MSQDRLSPQLTRRRMLVAVAGAGVTSLLAACGSRHSSPTSTHSSSTSASASANSLPVPREQSFVQDVGPFTYFNSFNPFWPKGRDYDNGFNQFVVEPYFFLNIPTGKVVPWLALSYTPASDYASGVMTLRQGVNWSDGQPFTSADVVFSFGAAAENAEEFAYASLNGVIDTVTALDKYTVQFKFQSPQPRFAQSILYDNGNIAAYVVPEHVWSGQNVLTFTNDPPVTTGAFLLDQSNPTLGMIIWKRNENYWGKAIGNFPKMQYIVSRTPAPPDEELIDFSRGVMDIPGGLSSAQATLAQSQYKAILDVVPTGPLALYFNCATAPFSNQQLRHAIAMLCNRTSMGKLWSPPTTGCTFPWMDNGTLKQYQTSTAQSALNNGQYLYNPTAAGQLLDQIAPKNSSGQRMLNGQPLTFSVAFNDTLTSPSDAIVTLLASECKTQGITVQVESNSDGATFLDAMRRGSYQAWLYGAPGSAIDPLGLYAALVSTGVPPVGQPTANQDFPRLNDSKLNSLVASLTSAAPGSASASLYDQTFQQFITDCPFVALVQEVNQFVASTHVWKGWPTGADMYVSADVQWSTFAQALFKLTSV